MTPNMLDMYHGDTQSRMPDFELVKAAGIWAVWHKATQGDNYTDPLCLPRMVAANKAGLLCGVYHFGDNSPVSNQLEHFSTLQKSLGFPVARALDFERNTTRGGSTMTGATAGEFIKQGAVPVCYGSDLPREFAHVLGPLDVLLWLAEYGPHENIPLPWTKQTTPFWQYSEAGSIRPINGHVDVNFFDGSQADLTELWGKLCLTAS